VTVDLKGGRADHLLQSGIAYPKSQTIGFIEHKLPIDQLLKCLFADVVARQRSRLGSKICSSFRELWPADRRP